MPIETPKINKWVVAMSVMLPTLIEIVDTSVVNVALNHIRGNLSAGIDEATWVITSYLVSNAIVIPITGWLANRFGRKRYLIFSIALFTSSSLMCGLAQSITMLVFFRVLQGIGGGALQPISQAILLETFPPVEHGIAMAVFGIGIMFGPIIGPLLGGWITDNMSWRWIFYINIPIGIIAVLMALFFIYDPSYIKRIKARVDYLGLMLLVIGLGSLQIVLDKGQREDWFNSNFIVTLAIVSSIALILFIVVELFTKDPVVNLRVFKNISFSTGNIVMFSAFFNLFGSIVLLPIYLQTLMGYSATDAGMVLGPGGIATLIAMPIAGRLITKMNSKYLLTFGIIMSSYATLLMSRFSLYASFPVVIWPRIVLGIGMGFLFIPLTTLTLSTIRKQEMGNATAIYNLLRNLGGSFGVAFVTTMLSRRAQFHQVRLSEHITVFDRTFQFAHKGLEAILPLRGIDSYTSQIASLKLLYGNLTRQASMMAFNDVFHLLSLFIICLVLLVPLMRRGKDVPTGMH